MVIKEVSQSALGDAGFNGDNSQFGIKISDAVKPAEIKNNAAVFHRIGTAVAPVITRAYGVYGDLPTLRNLQNR
ncbi:hypothetical protein GCM10011362_21930 [Marinobacter halophilus]|nr:hypothetical protein GCM10011362_21930 [Marinobacter halophilus]